MGVTSSQAGPMVAHVDSGRHGWVVLVIDVVPRSGHGVAQDAGLVNPGLQQKNEKSSETNSMLLTVQF